MRRLGTTRCTVSAGQLAAGAALVAVLAACGGAGSGQGGAAARPPAVEAVPARTGSLPLEEELSGVVRARNQVAIRPEISAAVTEVLVRNGDTVAARQPLVKLDDRTAAEQLRRAEADLRLAEASAAEARARVAEVEARTTRSRTLAAGGFTSTLDLETLEAQLEAARAGAQQEEARVEQARATVAERRSALDKTTVRAPVAGRVGQRNAEVGMVANASSILFLLGDFDRLIVDVPLTQEMLHHVTEGAPVEITARGGDGEPVAATVSRISPFLEAGSFSTTAEIDVPGGAGGLRPGMFVTARVLYGASESATLVPASALWEDPLTGDMVVFVVADAAGPTKPAGPGGEISEAARRVERRPVEVLAEGHGEVGVRGVAAGEWVVTLGQHLLQEGLETGGAEGAPARVRPTTWAHVVGLEALQREDLLARFLDKQRAVARAFGARMPPSTTAVEEALRAAAAADSAAAGTGAGS